MKNILSIVIAILLALFIRAFFVQAFDIPSGSMEPTLLAGDYILVNKFIYGMRIPYVNARIFSYKEPKRGDVIVFIYPKDPSKDYIKRVIGLPGETVQITEGKVYVDNTLIPDPWGYFDKKEPPGFIAAVENFGPVVVAKDCLFVMGDNRNNSEDSRFWGALPLDDVLGKAFLIYFSWNGRAEDTLDKVRWSRIGKSIR
ncbi:MAG TPA: signal peptidase I [Syntrophobacteraceae bacterium]|nr:signal peptidase I [Syntrophobacteraceae bacterium]